ncbi:hypothetical protein LFYK43_14020 [Ligilactobacillus salitolerans]|uniref:IrrE N-terminal-like domain-containing protein n=1 Tax=Ligilactobacillus salitolerans TaxID=1808352 RepID=A0A401ITR0_9LACO|nr:ImmA/IrrE family metallo-endopeptidase [Ligilactobacillus salitolerans]GBG94943.1 hypothetical protein LFYK43_14020 [Ligilactobacillus salitolerans]
MDDIIRWLCDFAFDHQIAVTLNSLSFGQNVPSCMYGRSIIVNLNWENRDELPFIFAHEIGHVLNEDEGTFYYSTATAHSKIEAAANERAINLLLDYCKSEDLLPRNYIEFMELYGIPRQMEEKVKKCFICADDQIYSVY